MTTQNTNEPQQVNQLNLLKSKKSIEIKTEFDRLKITTNQILKVKNIKRKPDPHHILFNKRCDIAQKNNDYAEILRLCIAENERLDLKYKTV